MTTKKLLTILLFVLTALPRIVWSQSKVEESVFAHISKNIAVTGETIWFSMKALDADQNFYSKIGYAELVDRNGQPVHQIIYPLYLGKSEGYIQIPKDLESDHYLLRFYTRISPKMSEKGIFNQFITVINPKKPNKSKAPVQTGKIYPTMKPSTLDQGEKISLPKKSKTELDLSNSNLGEVSSISISITNPFLPETHSGYYQGKIYQEIKENLELIPEPYGHIVHGKNLNPKIDTTETFFLSAHGVQSFLSSAKPKETGDLYFEIGALKAYEYLVAQSSDIEKQLNFSPELPFLSLDFQKDFTFPILKLEEKDRGFLSDLITSGQVSSYYYANDSVEFAPIVIGFDADKTYLLDDYTRFENLEVTLREYVPEVLVRKQDKKTLFKVLNSPLGSVFQENPLIMIDAMPVFDTDALAAFDPAKIQKLEVMTREFSFNQDKYSGVMSFTSFANDFGSFQLPSNALYLNYPEIQKTKRPTSFHLNPDPAQPHFPDFRSTLYWNAAPDISTPFTIFSSEIPGNFEITIGYKEASGKMNFASQAIQVQD
ncbi:hypothetical protein MMU07_00445 [Aquiflexum sp. LQ15W]|uniref:hypothetical protein n=1 Tax=Cognataquiflexum nitidum TaxID=2922272 RepID=UPI001F12D15A|nr:hypothetical protein [Cognataquiflexum nitidum]MCH6198029.1 hypothetical protein [Cognataquiflexum nitidum]